MVSPGIEAADIAQRPYVRCTRTIMDTTDPNISFDEQGVSSHVYNFEAHFAPTLRAAQAGERQSELDRLVEEIKVAGEGKPYDCIVGVSGGVDSSYVILQAVRLGLRPLAVHFDSGWNSELAVDNIHGIVTRLGVDLHTHVVDWREMKDLQLAFFKASVANCDIPTDHAFGYVAYQQAKKYGIKYILSGANYATESVLPAAWGFDAGDAKHLKAIHRRFGSTPLKTYPIMGKVKRDLWYPEVRRIRTVQLLNYMPYHYAKAKQTLSDELGWRDYGGKHYESVFTRYFQGYYLPHKFGYDKRLAHYSSMILSEQMTREEALALMTSANYSEDLRKQDHEFIAKKMGITVEQLEQLIAMPPVAHSEYPNSQVSTRRVFAMTARVGRVLRKLRILR